MSGLCIQCGNSRGRRRAICKRCLPDPSAIRRRESIKPPPPEVVEAARRSWQPAPMPAPAVLALLLLVALLATGGLWLAWGS